MCGRYVLARPIEEVVEHFGVERVVAGFQPSFNIAPTSFVPVVAVSNDPPLRTLTAFRWGLVPMWADSIAIGQRLVNARAETIFTANAYKDAFARRRCILPADGFYEWQASEDNKRRIPWYLRRNDSRPLAIAGLFERWRSESGDWLMSCTVITTAASGGLDQIHERMPLVIEDEDLECWLARRELSPADRRRLLAPVDPGRLLGRAVRNRVGNVRNDDPELLEPAEPGLQEIAFA